MKGGKDSGLGLLLLGSDAKKGEDSGEEDAKQLAAKAFLKAVKRDDAQALVEAFERMLEECDGEYGDAAVSDDDDESDDTDDE